MCGITGYFSLDCNFEADIFASATNIITYRGPDDYGFATYATSGKVTEYSQEDLGDYSFSEPILGAFGFRRLSIIDLSKAGHQPMTNEQSSHWIVFNGEIYNYLEIRQELENLGHRFHSNSDTEVALAAYCEWGISCLDKFNGMWALAILDVKNKTIFCARDRFGIKPFVYFQDDKTFAFASEPKQIQLLLKDQLEVNSESAYDFLIYGAKNHTSNTFYQNVQELRGGEFLTIDLANNKPIKMHKKRWWDLRESDFSGNENEAAEEMLSLLKSSIQIRLRSDVPTGTALSGGLDSNGVVALIDELTDTQQDVFTVFSKDKDLDESEYAQRSIDKFGLKSHKIEFGKQDVELLEKITFHHDQPLTNAGVFGGWILQQLIQSTGIIVNLNGQGADELMGGYSRPPHTLRYLDSLFSGHLIDAHQQLLHGIRHSGKSLTTDLKSILTDVGKISARRTIYKGLSQGRRSMLTNDFFLDHSRSSTSAYNDIFTSQPHMSSIQKRYSYHELRHSHLPNLLHNVDRDSMAHSLEARVPFLDYRIAEHIFSLPPKMLMNKGFTKYIYRKAMTGRIDDEILWNNNKKGFATPANDYLDQGSDYFSQLLHDVRSHEIVNIDWAKQALTTRTASQAPKLWRMLGFLIWDKQRLKTSAP